MASIPTQNNQKFEQLRDIIARSTRLEPIGLADDPNIITVCYETEEVTVSISDLYRQLRTNTNVTDLVFNGINLTTDGLLIAGLIQSNKTIKTLTLINVNLSDVDVETIKYFLKLIKILVKN
jgi:hypothetical protein